MLLTHTTYFGDISLYYWMQKKGSLRIEKYENYQKKSARNRSRIASPQETALLSVPLVKGKNNKAAITDVRISYDEDWTTQHLRTMKMGYSNSPFFEYYIDDITELLERGYETLWELNDAILRFMIAVLDLEVELSYTSDFTLEADTDFLDLRGYQKEQSPSRDCIFDVYRQPFDDVYPFISDLSILDLLFCKGPESILYLEKNISCST